MEAVIYTAQGDMRQALNNLQSTYNGFKTITGENVFKVCDEPNPVLIKNMIESCVEGDMRKAFKVFTSKLFDLRRCYCFTCRF